MAEHDIGNCPHETSDMRQVLIARRDELLREVEALRNKADGLGIAIGIVAEENGFTIST